MLGLTVKELKQVELGDFIERIAGNILWNKEKRETRLKEELEFQSWFTANIMVSSGNYKKSVSPIDIKEEIYDPDEMFGGGNKEKDKEERKNEYEEGKKSLMEAFDLEA